MSSAQSSNTAVLIQFPTAKSGSSETLSGSRAKVLAMGDCATPEQSPHTVRFETERVRNNMICELLQSRDFLERLQRAGYELPAAVESVKELEANLRSYNQLHAAPEGADSCYRDVLPEEADRYNVYSDSATTLANTIRNASGCEDDRAKLAEMVSELAQMVPEPRTLFTTRKSAKNPLNLSMIDFVANAPTRIAKYERLLEQMRVAVSEMRVYDAVSIKAEFEDLYRLHTAARQGFVGFLEVLAGGKDTGSRSE